MRKQVAEIVDIAGMFHAYKAELAMRSGKSAFDTRSGGSSNTSSTESAERLTFIDIVLVGRC